MDLLKRLEQHVDAFKKIAALPPGERGSHSKAVWREWARDVEAAVTALKALGFETQKSPEDEVLNWRATSLSESLKMALATFENHIEDIDKGGAISKRQIREHQAQAQLIRREIERREEIAKTGCTCAKIMAEDETRHFRGCPLREKYPDHPAAHKDPTAAELAQQIVLLAMGRWSDHPPYTDLQLEIMENPVQGIQNAFEEWQNASGKVECGNAMPTYADAHNERLTCTKPQGHEGAHWAKGRYAETSWPQMPSFTATELLDVLHRTGFRVSKNLAHPFLGPTPEDRLTLWCMECGRDSGFHYVKCSHGKKLAEDWAYGLQAEAAYEKVVARNNKEPRMQCRYCGSPTPQEECAAYDHGCDMEPYDGPEEKRCGINGCTLYPGHPGIHGSYLMRDGRDMGPLLRSDAYAKGADPGCPVHGVGMRIGPFTREWPGGHTTVTEATCTCEKPERQRREIAMQEGFKRIYGNPPTKFDTDLEMHRRQLEEVKRAVMHMPKSFGKEWVPWTQPNVDVRGCLVDMSEMLFFLLAVTHAPGEPEFGTFATNERVDEELTQLRRLIAELQKKLEPALRSETYEPRGDATTAFTHDLEVHRRRIHSIMSSRSESADNWVSDALWFLLNMTHPPGEPALADIVDQDAGMLIALKGAVAKLEDKLEDLPRRVIQGELLDPHLDKRIKALEVPLPSNLAGRLDALEKGLIATEGYTCFTCGDGTLSVSCFSKHDVRPNATVKQLAKRIEQLEKEQATFLFPWRDVGRPMTSSEVKKALGHDGLPKQQQTPEEAMKEQCVACGVPHGKHPGFDPTTPSQHGFIGEYDVWYLCPIHGTRRPVCCEAARRQEAQVQRDVRAAVEKVADRITAAAEDAHVPEELSNASLLKVACEMLDGVLFDASGTITFTGGPNKGETHPTPEAKILADRFIGIRDRAWMTKIRHEIPFTYDDGQHTRVLFKGWGVHMQRVYLQGLVEEHAYSCGLTGTSVDLPKAADKPVQAAWGEGNAHRYQMEREEKKS